MPHNTGRNDILNDVDKDEVLGNSLESQRGTDRKSFGPFLAIQNFFETQQEIKELANENLEMVQMISSLIEKKFAYENKGHVYFSVSSFESTYSLMFC